MGIGWDGRGGDGWVVVAVVVGVWDRKTDRTTAVPRTVLDIEHGLLQRRGLERCVKLQMDVTALRRDLVGRRRRDLLCCT